MLTSVLVFAGCAVALAVLVTPENDSTTDNAQPAGERGVAAVAVTDQPDSDPPVGGEVVLKRDASGHFITPATVNGARLDLLVDSGASLVVLGKSDAQRAGISVFPNDFTGTAQTAGGMVKTRPVVFDRVVVGSIERRNVPGAVLEIDMPYSLLGQSFLNGLDETRVTGDEMRLR